jgi:RNA polymerase subunit RPABC4/transcription elongation factor Spt4
MASVITAASSDNPFHGVQDFFNSGTWTAILRLTLFFFVVLWLALAFWVFKDAKRRLSDPILIAVSVATALVFPYVGALVYAILRPPEYLDDVRERELEIRAMERRLGPDLRCPFCRHDVEASFLVCPNCANRLKTACRRCNSPLEPDWRVCPYCETAVQRSAETVEI